MTQINANKVGLTFGGMAAFVHLIWTILVLIGWAQGLINFILGLHFLSVQYVVQPFSFGTALLLIIITAIIGYIAGFIFARIWNLAHKN